MRGVQLLQVNIKNLMAEAQWYESVREWRWPEGRPCPWCDAKRVMKRGVEENEPARQRYEGHVCGQRVDDLTGYHLRGASSTAEGLEVVSVLYGIEVVQGAKGQGAGLGSQRCAPDDP